MSISDHRGSNIPEARRILSHLASMLRVDNVHKADAASEIERAIGLMTRPTPAQRGKPHQVKITATHKAAIKEAAGLMPDASCVDIAELVGLPKTYGGRVSEILRGLEPSTHRVA